MSKFQAGSETTVTFLKFLILYMINFPLVQSRLQEELDQVVGRDRQVEPLSFSHSTEPKIMVGTWLGKLYHCFCLPVLPNPAWVPLCYVLHTLILGSV